MTMLRYSLAAGMAALISESAKKSGVKPPCALAPAFVVAT